MSRNVMTVYKKQGQTPLEVIDDLKKAHPDLVNMPLTYAGRLDPLASGVLVILAGDECLKKDEYLALDKEYELTILFGFATDTYDLMGKVVPPKDKISGPRANSPDAEILSFGSTLEDLSNNSSDFAEHLKQFTGCINQQYPPYSSRTVEGKPLYQWAREGRLGEITIPSHDVYVKSIDIVSEGEITGHDLEHKIKEVIGLVKGDFRQNEIIDLWENTLKDKQADVYKTITLKIACGSGVYVRGIAHELGQKLGIPALAFSIVRTKVGEYSL